MSIPTIPGSARVPDVQIGAKRNVQPRLQALAGVRKAAGAAEGAIDEGMSVVAEYEMRKQKAEETATFNSTSIKMLNATTAFAHTLKTQDDQKIVENWTQTSGGLRDIIKDDPSYKNMRPVAQRKLDAKIGLWQADSTASFQGIADKMGSQRRAQTAIQAKRAFAKTGEDRFKNNAVAALDAQRRAGDLTPQAYDDEIATMDEEFEKNQILNGIDNDPYATLQKINAGGYKNVAEVDLNQLRNTAERQTNFIQRSTGGDLINDFSTTGIPKTAEELKQLKNVGKITGEFVRNYNAMVERRDYKIAEDKQALLLNDLRDANLADSDNPEKDVRQITDEAASLPPQLQKAIHNVADSRLKEVRKGQEKNLHSTQLDLMRQSYEESTGRILISPRTDTEPARRAESLDWIKSMDDKKFEAEFGEDADRDEVMKTAGNYLKSEKLRYAKAQKDYVSWSQTKKGQEASPQEAADERERLGFGRYTSTDDVAASYKAQKIDRATAKEILHRQFGIP